jgi:hypothetical protein
MSDHVWASEDEGREEFHSRSSDAATHYEVFALIEGALYDEYLEIPTEKKAIERADGLAQEFRNDMVRDWDVFILPHFCGDSDECSCAQWLADHSPYKSNSPEHDG